MRKVFDVCPNSLGESPHKQVLKDVLRKRVAYVFDAHDEQFERSLSTESFDPKDVVRWAKDYRELLAWIGQFKILGGNLHSTQWEDWTERHKALIENTPGALGHDAFDSIQVELMSYLDVTPGDPNLTP